jgi:transcriptional regulator GlxA family with amidase domain
MTGPASVKKRALWVIGLSLSALVGVALTGTVGLVTSAGLIMAAPDPAQLAAVAPASVAAPDPAKPTVAVVLGNTRTEATDFLAPYALLAESGAYNVYAVADSRDARTLAGGVDVIPQLTFAELVARDADGPDVIVVPAITHIESPENASVLEWLRAQRDGATLFSWCVGAEVLAASGLVDGRPVTTHWGDIDGLEEAYPALEWRRGVRYVDEGDLVTTGGITSGVDATLHFLATRNGRDVADRVAEAMHYPASPYVDDPQIEQYTAEPVDAAVYLNLAFNWAKPQAAVWLYDGVGELDLASVVDAFAVTSTNATMTVADALYVTSEHGLQIVPRRRPDELNAVDRVFVPGGEGAPTAASRIPSSLLAGRAATVLEDPEAPAYAFATALEELASSHDVLIAEQAARQLEVRIPLRLVGPQWPSLPLTTAALVALAAGLVSWATVRLARRLKVRSGHSTRGRVSGEGRGKVGLGL